MKQCPIVVTLGLLALLAACEKTPLEKEPDKPCAHTNQLCDKATVSLGNKTNDTIFYGIGTNYYEDTLFPGEIRVLKGGKVEVTYEKNTCEKQRKTWSTWTIHSSWGEWAVNIDHCNKVSNFKYDDSTRLHIRLYDETED